MSSTWGKEIKISIFGESHSRAIGVVIDGFPAGVKIDTDEVLAFMARRAPAGQSHATRRVEKDMPNILSGIVDGTTCGTPICCMIENTDTRSQDYSGLAVTPRPGHADYTGGVRYGGFNDIRGGGHFSGRLTAPLCFAGALCMQYLKTKGVKIGAHLYRAACIDDERVDSMTLTTEKLTEITAKPMPVFNDEAGKAMLTAIDKARTELDSVGGIVECFALNLPAGAGGPMCETLEGEIASLLFSVPAVKGVEFGAGFGAADLKGSENNDSFVMQQGKVKTKTNNHGGILGGISSGMPVVVRAAFKPTPSIAREQDTVDLEKGENTKLCVKGRHDPCVAVRAVPCVEAAVALAAADAIVRREHYES